MRSERPKPLHVICGRPMVLHVLHALVDLDVERTVVVVGHGAQRVTKRVQADSPPELHVTFVEQRVQRGTGDAVMVGLTAFPDDDLDDTSTVLIVPGDTPAPPSGDARSSSSPSTRPVGTVPPSSPPTCPSRPATGACVRDKHGLVVRVVEEADATPEERAIQEVNTSIYCFRRDLLGPALRRLSPDNTQGEYYLTDVVSVLHDTGHGVDAFTLSDAQEVQGVNDRWQLALAERELRRRINRCWLLEGVTMLDPRQTFIDATVSLGRDVTLYPGTMLQGRTVVGDGCEIGPDTRLVDAVVGNDAVVEHAVAREAEIGAGAHVGPYAVLEPGSDVASRHGDRRLLHWGLDRRAERRPTLGSRWNASRRSGWPSTRAGPTWRLAEEIADHLGVELGDANLVEFSNGELPPPFQGERPGHGRLHHADPLRLRRPLHQRLDHGAAHHDRRRLPGLGQAHHGGLPLLRLRPPGPQGRGSGADHGPPGRRPVQGRRRQAHGERGPALGPDPGVLRRPGRPPHGHAGAGALHAGRTPSPAW